MTTHNLNPAQREAVLTLSGPLLVLAGAGSGKTRVVTYRIAELIRRGTRPSRILAVTFTNKAAREMQERAGKLLEKSPKEKPEISTFHSLCVRVLRRHARLLGYPAQFAIYDRGDQESIARKAIREIKVEDALLRPSELIGMIGRWKMQSIAPEQAASQAHSDKEHLASMAYRRYQQALRTAGALDFDDLLLCTEQLFEKFPDARRAEAARFSHLMIDEYQDTNGSQYRIVKALAAGHRNLCVVGDDDQAIYGWRGAEVRHILRFRQDWPDAKLVRLEENYRSTAAILDLANKLIAHNQHRHEKLLRAARAGGEKPQILQCQDEAIEAKTVVNDIAARLEAGQCQPRDFAILFRTNEQPRAFEMELRRAKLPYVLIGGMSFYDRTEVRDVMAYLKALAKPDDEVSLLRVINTPPRGIGKRAVAALLAQAVSEGRPLWEILGDAKGRDGAAASASDAVAQFRELIEAFGQKTKSAPLVDVVKQLVERVGYRQHIEKQYPDPNESQARWNAIEEVVNSVAAYQARAKRPTLQGFLDEIAVGERDDAEDKESQLTRNAIALMTLHGAKGLEFSQVYLIGLEEGLLPHHRSAESAAGIDEERRLFYVGITRAQDRLTMSLALSRFKWGKPRATEPSRFLFEIAGVEGDRASRDARPARGGRTTAHSSRPAAKKVPPSVGKGPIRRP